MFIAINISNINPHYHKSSMMYNYMNIAIHTYRFYMDEKYSNVIVKFQICSTVGNIAISAKNRNRIIFAVSTSSQRLLFHLSLYHILFYHYLCFSLTSSHPLPHRHSLLPFWCQERYDCIFFETKMLRTFVHINELVHHMNESPYNFEFFLGFCLCQ